MDNGFLIRLAVARRVPRFNVVGVSGSEVEVAPLAMVLDVLDVLCVSHTSPMRTGGSHGLVMAVMLGDSAAGAVKAVVDKAGPHWAKAIVKAIPMEAINKINLVLGPRFVTKYGTKQGVLVIAKQVPAGIGIGLGGGGNHMVGRGIVASTRKIFGEPPVAWSLEASERMEPDDPLGASL